MLHLQTIIHRPEIELSNPLRDLWIADISSSNIGTLGYHIARKYGKNSDELQKIREFHASIAEPTNSTFVWEYIEDRIQGKNIPSEEQQLLRARLNTLYFKVTSETLGIPTDSDREISEHIITKDMRYNVDLFLDCMAILGIENHILSLSGQEILALKYHPAFVEFKKKYFTLIEIASDTREFKKLFSKIYQFEAQQEQSSFVGFITKKDFINAFFKYCEKSFLNFRHFWDAFYDIIEVYKRFTDLAITDFRNHVYQTIKEKSPKQLFTILSSLFCKFF